MRSMHVVPFRLNEPQPCDKLCRVEVTGPEEEQKLGTYEIYQNYLKLVETKFEVCKSKKAY